MKYIISAVFFLSTIIAQAQFPGVQIIDNPRQIQLPYNRLIQPAGHMISGLGLKSLENHALDAALSPDGKLLAVMERYSIIFISTHDNKPLNRLPNDGHPVLKGAMNTYSGITWSVTDGHPTVYWSTVNATTNRSFVASATWDGSKSRIFEDI